METKPHHARVFKDPDHWPSWQVYYGNTWVGSAHTRVTAGIAAQITVKYAGSRCEQNLTPLGIIQEVNHRFMGRPQWATMWKPGTPHLTHTQHRELTRAGATFLRHNQQTGTVTWTWQPLSA